MDISEGPSGLEFPTTEDGYQERYVAFLDILGFSELVRRADHNIAIRDVIKSSIGAFHETLKTHKDGKWLTFTQFSDCVVLSAGRDENGMFFIIEACIRIAIELLKKGVLIRGGISIGNLYHTENLLFGTGLLKAYSHDLASGPPRIVIDTQFIEDGRTTALLTEKWNASIRKDEYDLSYIVHTLIFAETYLPDLEPHALLNMKESEFIACAIRRNSTNLALPPGVRAKWIWLRNYWNDIVMVKGYLPSA